MTLGGSRWIAAKYSRQHTNRALDAPMDGVDAEASCKLIIGIGREGALGDLFQLEVRQVMVDRHLLTFSPDRDGTARNLESPSLSSAQTQHLIRIPISK